MGLGPRAAGGAMPKARGGAFGVRAFGAPRASSDGAVPQKHGQATKQCAVVWRKAPPPSGVQAARRAARRATLCAAAAFAFVMVTSSAGWWFFAHPRDHQQPDISAQQALRRQRRQSACVSKASGGRVAALAATAAAAVAGYDGEIDDGVEDSSVSPDAVEYARLLAGEDLQLDACAVPASSLSLWSKLPPAPDAPSTERFVGSSLLPGSKTRATPITAYEMRDVCLTTIDNGPYTRDHPRDPGEDAQRVIVELTGDITEGPAVPTYANYAKRCVTCYNPIGGDGWAWDAASDFDGDHLRPLPAKWRHDGGRLSVEGHAAGKRCGMMWTAHATAANLTDYAKCVQHNERELHDRAQHPRVPPQGFDAAVYVRNTTVSLAWYTGNVGHQFFDSFLPLVSLLNSSTSVRAAVALQGHGDCPEDDVYICYLLQALGLLPPVTDGARHSPHAMTLIPAPPPGTILCFERLILPKHRSHTRTAVPVHAPSVRAVRSALTQHILPSIASAKDERGPKTVLLYSHAASSRRVWIDAGVAADSARAMGFDVRVEHDFGRLSFSEQARAFMWADVVVTAHGAPSAHAIYMREGALLAELRYACTSLSQWRWRCSSEYECLARIC